MARSRGFRGGARDLLVSLGSGERLGQAINILSLLRGLGRVGQRPRQRLAQHLNTLRRYLGAQNRTLLGLCLKPLGFGPLGAGVG